MSNIGQCFCYPTKKHGTCAHCNNARRYLEHEVYCLANELGEDLVAASLEGDFEIENLYHDTCPECGEPFDGEQDTCESCGEEVDAEDCDQEAQEIMQWFIVSRWLYNRLNEQGEPVAEWKGLCWWGRTCCGQGAEMDGTFQAISRALG